VKNVGAHLHCIPRATYSLFFCRFKHHAGHPIYNQCLIIVDGFVRLFTQVGAKFKDLFSVGTITPDGKGCVEKDFRLTKAGGLDAECLKVKKGFEAIASRLEKRRYAAYLGCTTEFRKWEVRTRFNFTPFFQYFFHGVHGVSQVGGSYEIQYHVVFHFFCVPWYCIENAITLFRMAIFLFIFGARFVRDSNLNLLQLEL